MNNKKVGNHLRTSARQAQPQSFQKLHHFFNLFVHKMKVNNPPSLRTRFSPRFLSCALTLPCTVGHTLQEKNKKIKKSNNCWVFSFREWDASALNNSVIQSSIFLSLPQYASSLLHRGIEASVRNIIISCLSKMKTEKNQTIY